MFEAIETQFQTMDAEWRGIMSPKPGANLVVPVWEADMDRLREEYHDLVRSGRWVVGVDDVLSIIRRARYEAHHSAILAWLLDPLGKHGLGTTLLASLLRVCGVGAVSELHRARPELEVQRGDTRADIVVFIPGIVLVIENKVDAGEQERQCARLFEHFGNDPGAVFVFLTPTGRAPCTATGPGCDVWTTLSYKTLARLLDESLRSTATNSAASGRSTAANYLATLRREFV